MPKSDTITALTVLWALERDGYSAVCSLHVDRGAAWLRMLCDAGLLGEYAFDSLQDAIAWADRERQDLLASGWSDDPSGAGQLWRFQYVRSALRAIELPPDVPIQK